MSLLIVPFVNKINAHLLDDWLSVVRHAGGLQNHKILFVAAPSLLSRVREKSEELRQVCPEVDVAQMDNEPQGNAVFALNRSVQHIDGVLRSRKNVSHFFPSNLTSLPLRPDAWDTIDQLYRSSGRLFMGCLLPLPPPREAESYMGLCGVWPGDLMNKARGVHGLLMSVNNNVPLTSSPMPIDHYLAGAIVGQCNALHTSVIDYTPGGHEFQTEGEDIVGKGEVFAMQTPAQFQIVGAGGAIPLQAPAPPAKEPPRVVVRKDALMHCGCRDGSLAKVLLSRGNFISTAPVRRGDGEQIPYHVHSRTDEKIDKLTDQVSRMAALMERFLPIDATKSAEAPTPLIQPEQESWESEPPVTESQEDPAQESSDLEPGTSPAATVVNRILGLLQNTDEILLGDACMDVGLTRAQVRDIIRQPGSGLMLDGNKVKKFAA